MAIDTGFTSKYRYFKNPWGVVDERFVRDVLLPGLNKQGLYSSIARGIQLDDENPPEYLPLNEASILILDWLSDANYLDQETVDQLQTLLKPGGYTQLAKILTAKFNNIGEQKRVTVATNEDRLEAYRQHLAQSGEPASSYRFSSAETIKNYHAQREQIITLLRRGYSTDYIKNLSLDDKSPISRALYGALADNLSRLYGASYQFGSEDDLRSQAVAKELFQIIRDEHPELTDLLPLLRDPQISSSLRRQIESTVNTLGSAEIKRVELARHAAIQAQANLLPNRSELRQEIKIALSRGGIDKSSELADAILIDIVASYGDQISAGEVVRLAAQHLGKVDPDNLTKVVNLLHEQGLDVAIEYHQQEMHVLYQGVRLSRAEKKLLLQGVSFLHTTNHQNEVSAAILQELGLESSPDLGEALKREYAQEQAEDPSSPRLTKLRTLQEHHFHSTHLSDDQIKLLKNSRFGRLDVGTKINLLTEKAYDFYDTATGGKIIRRFYDWYDKAAEGEAVVKIFGRELKFKTTLDIPLPKGKKLSIPVLRPLSWAFDQWDLLKKRATLRLYRFASSNKFPSWARRPTRWILRQYRLGDYEVSGAIFQFAHRQIGRVSTWALAKTGLSGVFKYAAKPSAGLAVRYTASIAARAAVRFAIKIGGKALGKLAAKAVTALLAAGTVIGTIFSAVMVLSLVVDLLKLGYQLIREFIRNANFRKMVVSVGATVGTIFLAIQTALATIGGIILLLPVLAQGFVIALIVALILIVFFAFSFQITNNTIPGLDVEYEPPASSANFGNSVSCSSEGAVPAPAGPGIPTRASEIIADLHTGFWSYCNRPTNPVATAKYPEMFDIPDVPKVPAVYSLSNRPNLFDYELYRTTKDPSREEIQSSGNALYWCTFLVQHSYRENGKSNFSTSLWSPTLEDEFRASHTFVEGASANGSNVKPGDIVFFKVDGGPDRTNHVGVVNSVDSGGFSYYQSNAPAINGSGTFSGGANAEPGVKVVGFGRL